MKKVEEAIIICGRVKHVNPRAKSRIEKCAQCGEDIWLSFSAIKRTSDHSVVKCLCGKCAHSYIKKSKEKVKFMPMSEEQINEIKAALKTKEL